VPKHKEPKKSQSNSNAYIAGSGIISGEQITDTLEKNYMPYAMSVIVSRAIPEIDGFKPSHRKLLYTMYKMGLLTGNKTKSANIVGQTMKLNPHGDSAIYDTMVRLSTGNEALLYGYVESKGNFGKAYSKNMAYAASRYTEAKLSPICSELFRDIDKDTVDFVPNYDNETTEPTLLPVTFPSILVNANKGIAVGMAMNCCSFNLTEVCDAAVALIKNPNADIIDILRGPDFAGGGLLLYDEEATKKIYETGRGNFTVRAKWNFDRENGCIEITEIPWTTDIESIMDKIIELVKDGKIQGISYIRDETDINGLKIAIDIKRGTDPEKLMKRLFKLTPLQDNFPCNFNILIAGSPRVMGVYEILEEWTAFRKECVKRRVYSGLQKKKSQLHLLQGLKKILIDIDKAVKIVRETDEEDDVVPNLMIGFGIDEIQAEYVAEIKLRHLNRQYILNRIAEIETLIKDIAEMESVLGSDDKIKNIIIEELKDVKKKYAVPRKTHFIYEQDEDDEPEDDTPDFTVNVFITAEGYIKKVTPLSLRNAGEQKLKEGDRIISVTETTNNAEILCFGDRQQCYKAKLSIFPEGKASLMGDFLPTKLGFDNGEMPVGSVITSDYSGHILFVFKNGKCAKIPLESYKTVTNRKKLLNAYSDKSPVAAMFFIGGNTEILLKSTAGKFIMFNSGQVAQKTTKNSEGVAVMTLKSGNEIERAEIVTPAMRAQVLKFEVKNIPSAGKVGQYEQMNLIPE
jgi:DNA gyrase subunit A